MHGYGHLTFSANVKFGREMLFTALELEEMVKRALIHTRFLIPGVAYTISEVPTTRTFEFRYAIPGTAHDTLAWSANAVTFHELGKSFGEAHRSILNIVWWKPSDERLSFELHVHPNPDSVSTWTFT